MAEVHTPIQVPAATSSLRDTPIVPPLLESVASTPQCSRWWGLALTHAEKTGNAELALVRRVVVLAIAAYFAYGAFLVLFSSARLIPNRWENTYPEAPHAWAALNTVLTGRLYASYQEPPYVLQPYGPLYYVLNALNAWLSGASVQQNMQGFVVHARIASFASFLLCGVLVFLICRRLSISRLFSGLAALMLFAQPPFFHSCVAVRPDTMFLACMALSLFVLVRDESPSLVNCFTAGALGGMAFLIKQPGAAAIFGAAVVWLLHRRFRQTACMIAGAAVPIVLMLLALVIRHENQFLAQYETLGKAYWSLPNGFAFLAATFSDLGILIPLGVAVIGAVRAIGCGERAQVLVAFTMVSWMVGIFGAPQVGGAVNYFFAGLIGCTLMLPFFLMAAGEHVKSVAVLTIVLLGIFQLSKVQANERNTILASQVNFAPDAYRDFGRYRILSDRPVFALYGKDPELLDPLSVHIMEVAGNWSSAPIVAKLNRGDYDFVILGCSGDRTICSYRGVNFFSRDVIQAMNRNYQVFCSSRGDMVLSPRARAASASPEMFTPAFGAPCDTKLQGHAPDLLTFGGSQ